MKKLRFSIILFIFTLLPLILWSVLAEPKKTEPTPPPNIETIRVSNETEFINAIGSNRIIELNPGTYSLSKFYEIQTDYVSWLNVGDGYQLNIKGIENLSIIGLGDEPVKIHIEPLSAYVLAFENARNITIKNIEAGHFPEKGSCQGGVLYFGSSKNIIIVNSILFGCGKEGLTLSQVENLHFINSIIKDCSYGIMTAHGSTGLAFSGSGFFNNQQYDLLNFTQCTNISFTQCDFSSNKAISGYGFLNTHDSKAIVIKDSKIHDNSAAHLLTSMDKGMVKITNTTFQNNHFYEGGYYNSIIDDVYLEQKTGSARQWQEFYKRLEYLSRKVNDPEKLDKPKARKLFENYWRKAIQDFEAFIKPKRSDWEAESLLGKFYQVGLPMDIKDAWVKAETHLKNAVKLNPASGSSHLALGVLYASKHLTFMAGEKDHESKLTILFKSQQPNYLAAAEKELLKDNAFPGTSNMYLFLIYYFQGKFEAAYQQAACYLEVFPDDELMIKLRGMAKKRIGNQQPPGELNVYISRDKTRRLFDFYFIQGNASGQSIEFGDPLLNTDSYSMNLKEFAGNGLESKLGETRKELIQNIGNPVNETLTKVKNRHQPDITDTIYHLTFDGFEASIYDTGGKEILLYQKITSPKYKVKYGLNIGGTKDKVIAALGNPQEEPQDQLIYCYYDEAGYQTLVIFSFTGDKITAIEWNFPVD